MFWKFTLESSGLDTLLAKEDLTLLEVLDEEDVLQECKTPNEKLLEFLTGDDILRELLHLVVDKPSEDLEDSVKYKYMNLATEIIMLDIDAILDKIASAEEFLDIIWSFMENPPPLNPLIASFVSKALTMLILRKSQQTLEYLKSHDAVNKLISHIEISAIMELFVKMVTVVELTEVKMEVCRWLSEEKLVEKLIDFLHPSQDPMKQFYSAQLLSELVHIGRDGMSSHFLDSEEQHVDNPLLCTLEKREVLEKLLTVMFGEASDTTEGGTQNHHSEASVVNGISVLTSLIEIKRPIIEGMEELISPMEVEKSTIQGCSTALEVIATKLPNFHTVLVNPSPLLPMETTFGILDSPLGKERLSIASLIAAAISSSSIAINEAVVAAGTMNILLDLFSRYEWNNFLHTNVQQCVFGILGGEPHRPLHAENNAAPESSAEAATNAATTEETETEKADTLLKHLFADCKLVERCLHLWEANEISEKAGSPRKGYMGHLTKIMNQIKSSKEKGPNQEAIEALFEQFPADVQEQWKEVCEGSLEEINQKNVCASMKSWFTPMDSDSENDDFRSTPITTSIDGQVQQAFENYQVKLMSNDFIESFGYDENSMQEQENIRNLFEEVGKVDFSINANEESENEKLYNNIMEQKIRPFDDSSDSEEEDMWEEKELVFSQPSAPRETTGNIRSDSESSSDEEKDDLKVDDSPNSSTDVVFSENMDVDSEWTANFDAFGVGTATEHEPSSDWPTINTVVTPLSTNGEDFADFSDIGKFECNDAFDNLHMDTEFSKPPAASSPYEVSMEEESDENSIDSSEKINGSLDTAIEQSSDSSSTQGTELPDDPGSTQHITSTDTKVVLNNVTSTSIIATTTNTTETTTTTTTTGAEVVSMDNDNERTSETTAENDLQKQNIEKQNVCPVVVVPGSSPVA